MARGRRDPVTIDVNVGGTMPTVVFRGKVGWLRRIRVGSVAWSAMPLRWLDTIW